VQPPTLQRNVCRSLSSALRVAVLVVLAFVLAIAAPVATSSDSVVQAQSPPPAGDESGLTVSPAIVDNTVDAGSTFTVPITLGNITQRAVPIEVTKGKLDTDQTPDANSLGKYDISSWFTIDTMSFLLPSQDRKTVNVTVKVPQNAEPGGHYATVFFGALAPSQSGGGAETLLNARVGVVFLLTIRGEMSAGADLPGGIMTSSPQWDAGASKFTFSIHNTGNVHFQPHGKMVIEDLFGRRVHEQPLPVGVVLPGANRHYEMVWERGVRPGVYSAKLDVDAGIELKAESKRFVILPLVVIVPSAVFLLVVVLIFWRARQVKKRRARRAAAVEAIKAAEPGEESPTKPPEPSNLQQSPDEEPQ
jgi:hypothetical protein